MREWRLVYCFSKHLSDNDKNFDRILYSLMKSIEFNSKFHKLKLYTDVFTFERVKHIDIEIEIFDYSPFRFIDDIKIQTLPILKNNDVLIDPDVFLHKKLHINQDCDLVLERPERITDTWYEIDYNESKKFKFSKLISLSSKSGEVGNIGILKFFNKKFMEEYINHYNYVRSVAFEDYDLLPPFPKFSILFGQLLLQNLIDDNHYNISYCKLNNKNKYNHLAGFTKYVDKEFIDKVVDKKKTIL
jgi:hypothetical protein